MKDTQQDFQWPLFILMASVTFMAMLSELSPSGVLPEMAESLDISLSKAGLLVGYYAIASAIFAIPMITLTVATNRKKLLLILLLGFALSNFVVALSSNFYLTIASRLLGGFCAGILWPMIATYGMRLVPEDSQGKAITVIMAGTTFALSLGLPAVTYIGLHLGWRTEFHLMGLIILTIFALAYFKLPSLEGEILSRTNSPFTMIKNPGILMVLLLTFFAVAGNYSLFTYITSLVSETDYYSIELAQIIFGVGSILSVVIAGRFTDNHLQGLTTFMFASGTSAMILFLFFGHFTYLNHLAFFLWGLGFGALVGVFQAAVTIQVSSGQAVATSLQSSTFNFSIMVGSAIGGLLLSQYNVLKVVVLALILLLVGAITTFLAKKTFNPVIE